MSFYREKIENPVIDCSKDEVITEQSHLAEVDINNIIKKHGIDLIQQTSLLQSHTFQFDDVTGNDFQEAMNIVAAAQQSFDAMPSSIRSRFDNSPAMFLDFVQDPKNHQELVTMGLALPTVEKQPIEVIITNPATPPV